VKDLIFRFLIGGVAVSAFAGLGDVLKPKSFAGLFGAAPSIALAALGLTIAANGKMYAATEARSMMAGALVFFLYAWLCFMADVAAQIKGHVSYVIGAGHLAGVLHIDLVVGSEGELA
jgi:hypothetical protein